jgi:uncharacterized protein YbaA (DUF1428 family)
MSYVDGFVLPVPKKNLAAYRRMARKAGQVWREHGALEYRECVADDVQSGKLTSFPQSVKLKPDETVIFAWIVYKSRAQRDPRQQEGDGGSASGRDGRSQVAAVRWQAHVLGRIQDDGRSVIDRNPAAAQAAARFQFRGIRKECDAKVAAV